MLPRTCVDAYDVKGNREMSKWKREQLKSYGYKKRVFAVSQKASVLDKLDEIMSV
jgi:hypothetical protein